MKQHEHVRAAIERSIVDGTYTIGEALPRLAELAAAQACSIATVRRAMRDLIDAGVVESAKKRGTVVLRKPAAGRVVLALSSDPHTNMLLQEPVCTALTDARMDVDIIAGGVGVSALQNWCRRLLADGREPDALVSLGYSGSVTSWEQEMRIFESFFSRRVRVLFECQAELLPSQGKIVAPDWRRQAQCLADFLLDRGHRQVAIFPGYPREAGGWYDRVAQTFGEHIAAAGGRSWPLAITTGEAGLLRLIRDAGVTAYVALNDSVAMSLLSEIQAAGIRIPGDFSLIGRNDTPWAEIASPPLTSLSVNPEAMAQLVLTAIRDLAAGDNRRQLYEVSPKVVARSSTGPAARP